MNFSIDGPLTEVDWESRVEIEGLYETLKPLKDQRNRRGIRYPLAVAVVMIVVAKLSGQDEVRGIAEWVKLRTHLFVDTLKGRQPRMPHHTTVSRILNTAVDMAELEAVVNGYLRSHAKRAEKVAIDGKTLRGTIEAGHSQGQHLLSTYDTDHGLVMGQVAVGQKENERSAAAPLLADVDWQGRVVTGDAMFAQHQVSAQIVEAGGAYVWVVKDNQPTVRAAIERRFAPEHCLNAHSALVTDFQSASKLDKAHGRLEKRTLTTSCLLNDFLAWEGLGQVFKIERQVDYGLTSLSPIQASPTAYSISSVRTGGLRTPSIIRAMARCMKMPVGFVLPKSNMPWRPSILWSWA
jgi:predicted transposase YbfD/YdcC